MINEHLTPNRQPVRFERTYDGPLDDLWDRWTTKDGFEAWWGPEGFRVEVSSIEPKNGGRLGYDMIAVRRDEVAQMTKEGWAVRSLTWIPAAHASRRGAVGLMARRREGSAP